MPVDTTRALMVTHPYRYAVASRETIRNYPKARVIDLETGLDVAGATALATSLLDQTGKPVNVFEVPVEGIYTQADFIGGAPRFRVFFDRHPAGGDATYVVTTIKPKFFSNQTILTVKTQ